MDAVEWSLVVAAIHSTEIKLFCFFVAPLGEKKGGFNINLRNSQKRAIAKNMK